MPPRMPTSRCGCGRGFKPRLPAEGATRVYEMVDRPLVPVIARMERRGIKVDRERAAAPVGRVRAARSRALEERDLRRCRRQPFTIGSPKQLGDVLFDQMGLKGGRKGKSGVYSTDVTELERLARAKGVDDRRPGARLAPADQAQDRPTPTRCRQQINPETGRVHTCYQPDRRADRAAVLDRPQPPEHPDPHRDRPPDPRRLRRRAGQRHPRRRLFARSSCGSPRTWPTCRS